MIPIQHSNLHKRLAKDKDNGVEGEMWIAGQTEFMVIKPGEDPAPVIFSMCPLD